MSRRLAGASTVLMPKTAIIIGSAAACERLERQLDLLADRPVSIGWVLVDAADRNGCSGILGTVDELEAIVARRRPAVALVALPAAMSELITAIRTRLRRLGVPDRFMPMLEDQLAGVGPRTHIEIDLAKLLARPPREMDEQAVRSVVQDQRVLITGAGGSIGSELSRIVARFGPRQLVLMDRAENALFEIDRQIARLHPDLPRRAALHDVVDGAGTLELLRTLRPQLIFHAAAHKHVPMMEDHPAAAVENNFFGTKSVADAAHEIGAERFVLISTDKAVNPKSIMGATKRLAELYVQHLDQCSDTRYSMVRFGNVLGSSGSVLEIWARQIADGGPLTVTDPRMTRYFMTIPEAASLVIQATAHMPTASRAVDASRAVSGRTAPIFVLDMGQPIRILDLARRFAAMHGLKAIVPEDASACRCTDAGNVRIVFTGIRPGEKLVEELAFDAETMEPTSHPDINIWMLPPPHNRYVEQIVDMLSSCCGAPAGEAARIVRAALAAGTLEPAAT